MEIAEEIIRSDEEIKNTISENFEHDIEMINVNYKGNNDLRKGWFSSFPQEILLSLIEERTVARFKIHWTLSDISKICIYFDIDCVKRYGETRSHISSHNIEKYRRWLDRIERFSVDLIRSKVWDGTLTPGKDVFLHGKDFGDDPKDSISASAFIRIVDEENKINEKFSIIRIPDNVREIVEKREKTKVAADKKSDGEIVQAYLKAEFIKDIRNGVSRKDLLDKFTPEDLSVFDETQKQKCYKYTIDGREIIISKELLGYIASILLDVSSHIVGSRTNSKQFWFRFPFLNDKLPRS